MVIPPIRSLRQPGEAQAVDHSPDVLPSLIDAVAYQTREPAVLVAAHQARTTHDIRRQNHCQSPHHPLAAQIAPKVCKGIIRPPDRRVLAEAPTGT